MAGERKNGMCEIVGWNHPALPGNTALKMPANFLDRRRILHAFANAAHRNDDREGLHREMLENGVGFAREEPRDGHPVTES